MSLEEKIFNPTEREEREYLEEIKEKLRHAIHGIEKRVQEFSSELRENKEYFYKYQSGMDEADMVAAGQSINRIALTGESAVATRRKLLKLLQSPYFGRIDFVAAGETGRSSYYIGIHSFTDQRGGLIYDWRAPVSSMFYDFELGDAFYETPSGRISGAIDLKRQYRIVDGRLEYMIENELNIQDTILQKELSRTSDEKMKNIVATIQRDQNAVIRDETSQVLIIQGVAGSGKTSIALHRVAFLLYRFRDSMASKDLLIISPNKVFADYISNVLPELGEEQIPEIGMEELAAEVLQHKVRFQSFFEQVSLLLEDPDKDFVERIRFKSTFDFLSKLNQYVIFVENNYFTFTELRVGKTVVPFPFILEKFKAYHRVPILRRFPLVVKDIQHFVREDVKRKLTPQERRQIEEAVPRMFRMESVLDLYQDFFTWIKRDDMFSMKGGVLEYADVYPLIYFMIRFEGVTPYDHVRHLLVDEMQDYTPVQYSVLSRLFKCKKTILGDVSQQVNPYSASSSDDIHRVFPQGEVVKLVRSYRSTVEITRFAQQIFRNDEIIPMERHGEEPEVKRYENNAEELESLKDMIGVFRSSGHQTLGIICKTEEQSQFVHHHMKASDIFLLSSESTAFRHGIVISTAHLAKGLEFDEVIVPFASSRNYHTDIDKRMLYIACTRAMHKLTLTYSRNKSSFI